MRSSCSLTPPRGRRRHPRPDPVSRRSDTAADGMTPASAATAGAVWRGAVLKRAFALEERIRVLWGSSTHHVERVMQ
ncbi:hypothetical protein HMPREF1979_02928 [Actinomyces johnsonii F0542]|uniref:Uncharacterized protein n=1 Tax=Actinomyces johnsonii F0542 TaxID=1321818 RepID=U1QJR7_9ACTO|nr:hypothetical protein HMPREF1979_02928 [Actinomyces johnsonii F0542]